MSGRCPFRCVERAFRAGNGLKGGGGVDHCEDSLGVGHDQQRNRLVR